MKVIRLTPLPMVGFDDDDWSVCVNESEMEEEEFLAKNDSNLIPFYEIWEQEETTLSALIGCEVCRINPTVDGDSFAINDEKHRFILIRATRYHVLLRIEAVEKKIEDPNFCKTILLDSRYANPIDWKIKK